MKISLYNGSPAIYDKDGELLIYNISCGVRYKGAFYNTLENMSAGEWKIAESDGELFFESENAKLWFSTEGDGIKFRTEYTNTGDNIEKLDDFIVIRGCFSRRLTRLFGNTLNLSNGIKTNEMLSTVQTLRLVSGQRAYFGDFAAVEDSAGRNFIAGFLTFKEFFGRLSVSEDGSFEVCHDPEMHPLANGESLKSDLFYITECDDIVRALPDYCDISLKYMCENGPRKKFDVPTGYCTWYYYLNQLDERIIKNSVEDLKNIRETIPVKYMQVDDGWQISYGDWEANDKFPEGMKACADNIRAAGLIPGLWFAPFWAGNNSSLKKEHPEYFAKSRVTGEISNCLDFSVPEVCDLIGEVFRRASCDWGFKYLKLDGISTVLGAHKYARDDFNSAKNYRKCLEIINASVSEDTFILGCTAPFGGGVGLVDGMRVSCDIFEHWGSICDVFNSVLNRYYYHNRYFINDSDCLIIRTSANEDAECRRPCLRTDEEIKTYISVTAASGGTVMFSDKMCLLDEGQLKRLGYLFPLNSEAALPLDLMDSKIPGVLDCGKRGKVHIYMLVNWDNVEKEMSVNVGDTHIFEFWSQKYLGKRNGVYKSKIAPHSTEVIFATEADTCAVIGTDDVIIPTIRQSFENGTLSVDFIKKGETIFVAADFLNGDGCEIKKLSDGLYSVKQTASAMSVSLKTV